MKRLLLVRHGQTEWNALRRLQGQADIALSPRGREQALALAPMVAALAPDLVLTSDLSRAAETAGLLGHAGARHVTGLREQSLGDWTGVDIAAITAATPDLYLDWRAGRYAPPGGEIWAGFRARVAQAATAALAEAETTALLVCHGGVIRAALDALLGLPPSRIIPVGPASLTILAFPRDEPRLEAFNVSAGFAELNAPD